ncbi:ORC1-type DNA replication protein [Methanobrevibacter sp.]|uniref:ORC1-type DNA replication protein n=1 Tax=Methanobrevibacter sp. TaxID=66852 RepID=UPI00388DAD10
MDNMGIEDILMHDESLFQNINAFDPDYVPQNYNFRDTQMEGMAIAIRPAMRGGQPSNAVILGSPATGKTTAIKKVFELVEKNTEKVVCVYINCQIHTTRFGIFSQIYKKLFGHIPPETGVPFSRIYDQIMRDLQKDKKSLVVALDDINYLFQSNNANKVVYDILRAYEEYPGVRSSIFAILSDLEFRYAFDKNVNTVFIPQEITFPLYTYNEIESILRDRAKAGFFPGVLSDDILEQISMYTLENGDLRVGINLLKSCGNIAEASASREITQEHFDKAVDSLVSVNISETLKSLNDIERQMLRLIADYDGVYKAGELSEIFMEKTETSYGSFKRTLDKLEFVRLIDTKYTGKGARGNSREIILRFNPDDYDI